MKNVTLIAARKKVGKTQKQVAVEVGISTVGYRKYEHGERTPSAPIANSIAKALNTTSEKLFGYFDTNVL